VIGLNVAAFGVQHLSVGDRRVLDWAVPDGPAIASGQVWRPFSSLFVHPGGAVHLGINNGLLLIVGPIAEQELGRTRFIGTYLLGGTATNALRYLVGGHKGGGASAAICAAAGAAAALRLRRTDNDTGNAVTAVAAIAMAAGLGVARRTGDNHLLALGIGALTPGRSRDRPIRSSTAV
jgi:membrane associated rhomboid family serine protease